MEGFADAVFAFALTLLVVSLEVPNTFDELLATMRGFFAFAISGWLLYAVWFDHYMFFRRYGLQDTLTMHLSSILLFVDRKSTRLNSSHANISYAVFCLKKKKKY